MTEQKQRGIATLLCFLIAIFFLVSGNAGIAKAPRVLAPQVGPSPAGIKKPGRQSDSFNLKPAADLVLRPEGEHKAGALAHFIEGMAFEENGEMDQALEAYRKVLNVDPGQSDLASRVAAMLIRQDDFPQAIDVLKDAIKANPNDAEPYRQLAFIYAKYLKKTDQAVDYANRAIALDPRDIEAYQRLCEIELAAGDEKKARDVLERATKVHSDDAAFWTQLGKLYAAILFKIDVQPDDANAREKLATGFILTNQRGKAVEMLEQIIKQHPEKYQPYDLLAQVLDDEARSLQRAKRLDEAKAEFAKVAANYEQSLLINPNHAGTYLRLAELLLGPLKDAGRAVKFLTEARRRFPGAPEIVYYLALAQREAKQTQQAVATFEEALHEAELDQDNEIVNAKFYFNYGATAEQAGLYEKAADLLRKSIALDPANAAEAYNYLGYMWADHNMNLDEAE